MNIPAPLRDQLAAAGAERLVITCTDRCLEIFTVEAWEKLVRKFDRLPQMKEEVELFELFYISSAMEVPIDKQGRVLVPSTLREQVSLNREIVVVGNKGKIQVYASDIWQKVSEEARRRFAEIRNLLSEDLK